MNVNELCKRGFYDKITVNFVTEPIYGDDIEIFGDMSFNECTSNEINAVDNSIFKVRLNILGVEFIKKHVITPDELSKDRKRDTILYKIGAHNNKSYLLAYVDLIVVRDCDRTKYKIGDKFDDTLDKSLLVNCALKLQKKGSKENLNNILIVDKVYVYERYRQCGISTWIHANLRDIVYKFMGMPIGDMLLIPGDFSEECNKKFNMSETEYVQMLKEHYNRVGYEMQKDGLMINRLFPEETLSVKLDRFMSKFGNKNG